MSRLRDTLLWTLSDKVSGDFRAHLFGSMHIGNEATSLLVEALSQYVEAAEAFFAEVDLDEPADFSGLFIPGDLSYSNFLSQAKIARANDQLTKSFGVPVPSNTRVLPFFLISQITEAILASEGNTPLDMALWQKAKEKQVSCLGIESRQFQMEILEHYSIDDQFRQLLQIVRKPEKFRKKVNQLSQYYLDQRIHQLYRASRQGLGTFRAHVLTRRNYLMADRIDEIIQSERAVIAVGAGHLAGGTGLIHLLKQKGWSVKPEPLHFVK